ncbi:MAG: AbrB family transcriptional regulator [Acidaminococcaceae bacterium]|jgi:membrane AbrB-like protein|nr:AbrB family transcriptional regulator [Acidaminococcaceae bacterium]
MNGTLIGERCGVFAGAVLIGRGLESARIPIPYMLGGILAMLLVKIFGDRYLTWPHAWQKLALCVAGYGIGRNFTLDTWNRLLDQTAGVFAATFISMALSLLIALWTHRHTFANLLSCVMGILPGGLMQMMVMSEEDARADANVVMVSQTLRLLGVVMFVPFLVVHLLGASVLPPGAAQTVQTGGLAWWWLVPVCWVSVWAAQKLHVPTANLIGPILGGAIFSCAAGPLQTVPDLLMSLAQINIGLYMGAMLDKERLWKTRELLPYILGGTAAMIGVSVVVAKFLAGHYHFSLVAAFLGMAPGGIAEMCLAGMSMGEDVSMILTYQIVRVMVLNITVPYALHWYFDKDYQG